MLSSTMTQDQLDREATWKMPSVQVGDIIHWFARYNVTSEPSCARVTRVSTRSIECRVDNGPNSQYQFDVLHIDDPRLHRNQNMQQNGSWHYSPLELRLRRVEAALIREEASGATERLQARTSIDALCNGDRQAASPLHDVSAPRPKRNRKPMSEEARKRAGDRLREMNARKRLEAQQHRSANQLESASL